jgi:sugar phosphate isomerase/epimerase
LEELLKQLPHAAVGVDFDPAELLLYGHSPVDTMRAIASRVSHFRARDGVRDLALGRGVEVQLGRGSVDFPQLLGMLEEQAYAGYLTVERRESSGNALVECGQALEYLSNLFG